jgi:hypothetical protein
MSKVTFEEKEYRAYEAIAKKTGFKSVDDLVTFAIVQFLSSGLGGNIKPENTEEFLDKFNDEYKKNPDLDIGEFVRNFKATPKIETVEVKVNIPKKLYAFLKDKRKADLKEYLSNCLTDTVAADIEAEVFGEYPDQIKKEYGLTEEFEYYEGH